MSMTVGEVIEALSKANPDVQVRFAFGGVVPTRVDSWRGVYAEPALGFKYEGRNTDGPTAAALLAELRKAISGEVYSGWKGGEYTYRAKDTLHIDNPGAWTQTELTRVEVDEYTVLLHTAREE